MRRHLGTAAVTITDPLVKYQSLVQTGVYLPDPAQHRLALHLQKLYKRLKDYTPSSEYRARLQRVTQAVETSRTVGEDLAAPGHPIRRNPLFARFFRAAEQDAVSAEAKALTRVLTSHQAALEADSPRGLFLSGEVGTGKSMLVDLLADGLPTRLKRRWHFNTFMLHAFSRLEQFRRENQQSAAVDAQLQQQYSMLWLAKELVETSPILFLDEFQLPDRAASKLLSNLFIAFFQLGGVLVASSNRMPEELERASGLAFRPPTTGGLVRRFFGAANGAQAGRGELYGPTSDFAAFLEVLKARCDFFHIEGTKDWRRRDDAHRSVSRGSDEAAESPPGLHDATAGKEPAGVASNPASLLLPQTEEPDTGTGITLPAKYFLGIADEATWPDVLADGQGPVKWESAELSVYGRRVSVPKQHQGVALWDFENLVSSLGPADFITLASNYHTFIIDRVPILPTSRKNEARRFITLLDALYEARCKLIVRAEAGPDDLFFPDVRPSTLSQTEDGSTTEEAAAAAATDHGDATYSETVAEVYQDQLAPFRPNVSVYESPARTSRYDPDQDSDFGLEGAATTTATAEPSSPRANVNFSDAGAFTGEDERFAYRRAASRLWELCSARWHARDDPGWWQPLPAEARHWEGRALSKPLDPRAHLARASGPGPDARMGPSVVLDEPAGLARFRVRELKESAGAGEG